MISHQKQNIQFADYAPLVDAEQLLKTAQVKQNLADENIATIKSTVDAYSRLRSYMINDASKNYFDQELKKLTSAIRDSAGLDFSNKGNLANVLAIGRPFENDKYIINGLKAGKERERRLTELNAMDPESRSEDNDLVFMMDIYDYMEKGGLDTKVTEGKTYTPYVDMTEEILKMEKEIEAEVKLKVSKLPGGLLDVQQIKEKTKEEVMNRIALLSPEHQTQLNIHAQAEMHRIGTEGAYNRVKSYLSDMIADQENLANIARANIADAAKLPGAQRKAIVELNSERLKTIDQTLYALNQELQTPPEKFNPMQYLPVFRNEFLGTIAQKAAYRKVDHTIKNDQLAVVAAQNRFALEKERRDVIRESNKFAFKQLEDYTRVSGTNFYPGDGPGTIIGDIKEANPYYLEQKIAGTFKSADGKRDIYEPALGLWHARNALTEHIKRYKSAPDTEQNRARIQALVTNRDILNEMVTTINNAWEDVGKNPVKARENIKFDFGSHQMNEMGYPVEPVILTMDELRNMSVEQILQYGQFDVYRVVGDGSSAQSFNFTVKPKR